ncbi:MAG: helix-turn-helix domain-containing protein [Nanoarchaeota archaeon]|nr:helix-turn-helix domain-containing protein [Nanoarchaeota archaeon]
MGTMVENMKIIHPQEIEAWYVIPMIRKELAFAMKKEGLDQKGIAKLLGITPAAVSQYISKKRASNYEIEDGIKFEFIDSARRIAQDKSLILSEFQRLMKICWDEGVVCEIHKSKSWCPEQCEVCYD